MWAAAAANVLALLLTFAVNIPLNDALAGAGNPSELRQDFEGPWVTWNAVRGVLVTVGLGCLAAAAAVGGRSGDPARPAGSRTPEATPTPSGGAVPSA